MPAPLIAAGAGAARGGAAIASGAMRGASGAARGATSAARGGTAIVQGSAGVVRGAAGTARGSARTTRVVTRALRSKKKRSLVNKIAAARIVWAAALFDLTQLFLNLIYLGIAEFVESLPIVIRGFIEVIGGEYVVLFVWALSVMVMVVGYFALGYSFVKDGTKLVGERYASVKLPLLILCMTADYMFPVNGYLPGMTLWAWYLWTNPK